MSSYEREIDASNNCISLSNGNILCKGESQGGLTDEVMNFQIRKTDEEHLKKELRLNAKGIKALSLFFIDKVANYRQYDEEGNHGNGKFNSPDGSRKSIRNLFQNRLLNRRSID